MKVDAALAFCLLCFHFETPYGAEVLGCPSQKPCPEGNLSVGNLSHPQYLDEFPKDNFTFHYILPSKVKSFHIKLFKGQREICALYIDNGERKLKRNEKFCDITHSADHVSFILRNLKSKHSDTYICCLEILYPIYSHCKADEKHLYIQDSALEEPCLLSDRTSWILIGLTVFFFIAFIFCLIQKCVFRNVICQDGHSNHDYNNEYMSMAAVKPH